uniref:Uncharacterized protein n=1 Tax=Ananas comosus var. bracteatus TaxID=296719 RepID=A0A6V7PDR8_ANACO|nr:unnamed protein product [Ananas comosus var. bracteatus]
MLMSSVQGLNPLMFTFALIGNATYVGSILVNSLDWNKIRPNLPWIVDAGGCVLLDSFEAVVFFRLTMGGLLLRGMSAPNLKLSFVEIAKILLCFLRCGRSLIYVHNFD